MTPLAPPATKYRTIVVDPPWEMKRGSQYRWREGKASGKRQELDYPTLTVDEIAALQIPANDDAHLFVWTTQRHLEATPGIVRAWGFTPSCTLAWCKAPHGWGPGGVFQSTLEFVIYARFGSPDPSKHSVTSQWFQWPRGEHSAKPEAFLDLVEQHFPGPYLEMFSRRARLGWDSHGNESLGHVELAS